MDIINDMRPDVIIVTKDGTNIIAGITFLIITDIVIGKDGIPGIVNIVETPTNTEEDATTMTTKETWCLPTVKTTETVQPVSRSEFISRIPCYKCLVFVMCKQKITDSVVSFAHSGGCPDVKKFVLKADMDQINTMRVIFGLKEYP